MSSFFQAELINFLAQILQQIKSYFMILLADFEKVE